MGSVEAKSGSTYVKYTIRMITVSLAMQFDNIPLLVFSNHYDAFSFLISATKK